MIIIIIEENLDLMLSLLLLLLLLLWMCLSPEPEEDPAWEAGKDKNTIQVLIWALDDPSIGEGSETTSAAETAKDGSEKPQKEPMNGEVNDGNFVPSEELDYDASRWPKWLSVRLDSRFTDLRQKIETFLAWEKDSSRLFTLQGFPETLIELHPDTNSDASLSPRVQEFTASLKGYRIAQVGSDFLHSSCDVSFSFSSDLSFR